MRLFSSMTHMRVYHLVKFKNYDFLEFEEQKTFLFKRSARFKILYNK